MVAVLDDESLDESFRAFGKLAREKIRMFPQPGRSQKLVFLWLIY
jgi:hypothetical protein